MSVTILEAIDNLSISTQSLTDKMDEIGLEIQGSIAELSEAMRLFRNCGCAGDGEHTEPDEVLDETDPPPTGFSNYDDVTFPDRKCKLSNMIYDDLLDVTKKLDALRVTEATGFIGQITSIIGFISASVAAGPMGWALGILGAISGLVTYFLTNIVNLTGLVNILENPQVHEDFVNALYNATSSQGGYDAAYAVLTGGGASGLQLAYIDALRFLNQMTVLFFLPDGEQGTLINQRLDGYPTAINCQSEGPVWIFSPSGFKGVTSSGGGSLGTGTIDQDGGEFTVSSVPTTGGQHAISLQVEGYDDNPGVVTILGSTATLVSATLVSSPQNIRDRSSNGCGQPIIYNSASTEQGNMPQQLFDNLAFHYIFVSPATMTLSIDTKPTVCP